MRAAIAEAEIVTPPTVLPNNSWNRPPDASILRVNCSLAIAADAVEKALASLLEDAAVDADAVEHRGLALGRSFSLHFRGAGGLAAKRAAKVHSLLRLEGEL